MEKSTKSPSAEELLRKIQDIEQRQAHIKQQISKQKLSANNSKHAHQTTSSHQLTIHHPRAFQEFDRVTSAGIPEPLTTKLTETQYLNILQSVGQAIHVYDFKHGIIFWNRAAERLYGYTAAESYGRTPIELLVDPKDALMAEFLQERAAYGENWAGEFPIINKHGERFVVFCTDTPYRDEDSRLLGAICLSSDARMNQVVMLGLTVCAPTPVVSARHGHNYQNPPQNSTASKISNFVSKLKSNIKTGENYTDHENSGSDKSEESTPRGHIGHRCRKPMMNSGNESVNKSGFRCSLYSITEELMVKSGISWPWKGSEGEAESILAKLGHFGWHRFNLNQAHEPGSQMRSIAYPKLGCQPNVNNALGCNKIEASAMWFSTTQVASTSSTSSSSSGDMNIKSNASIKVDGETNKVDYEIMWEDLIVKEQIGQGSVGIVYHGLWCGSDVAVKLFAYQDFSDDVMISFKKEVSLIKRLRHPNILLFMGAVTAPQHLCIVTEFLSRGSLFRIFQRNTNRLDWKRRFRLAMDIARGMNYLHLCSPPIVHRDLKSSNLLVDENWTVKVGDFGLSRIRHHTHLKTKTGKGTPQWMAPELLRNEQADEKSDVYSYGVVLWEIVTEKIPWDNLNPMQVIGAVGFMNQRLVIPKEVDPMWSSLIESCWQSDPQCRPTFQEILFKLKDMKKKFAALRKKI